MIWSKYLSLMLIALTVLVLTGCEASYTALTTEPQRSTEKSPYGFTPPPTPTPKPTPTPNPLASVIKKYMLAVEQFQTNQDELAREHKASVASVIARAAVYPQSWKAEFIEILNEEAQLIEKWKMIEPPEAFLGFHETYARGLKLFIDRRDLFVSWADSFKGSPQEPAPWERDTLIANDQRHIFSAAAKGWRYGTATVRPTPTIVASTVVSPTARADIARPRGTSQFSRQITAVSAITERSVSNCLTLNIHYEYAFDSRWKAETEFAKRDADRYMAAVGAKLRDLCD